MTDTMKPGPKSRPRPLHVESNTVTIPASDVERLGEVLGFAYAATWTAADEGQLDWTTVGEPIAEAVRIVQRFVP